MNDPIFDNNVFINCPLDVEFAPLLEAMLFSVVYFGYRPKLATGRLENGESRLEKIVGLISTSKFSIHDLSRCRALNAGDHQRMNMPFELGIDYGVRRSGGAQSASKRFLIFEGSQYELKRALSDLAGQDVEFHKNDFETVIKKVRDFFRVEANVPAPGTAKLVSDYVTFQGWMIEKKIAEGHSEKDALKLPTQERLDEMISWNNVGRPTQFT